MNISLSRQPESENLRRIVAHYVSIHRDSSVAEAKYFKELPSLTSVIEIAGSGRNRNGQIHAHQRRVRTEAMESATKILLRNAMIIGESQTFDDLHALVGEMLEGRYGIGEMYL